MLLTLSFHLADQRACAFYEEARSVRIVVLVTATAAALADRVARCIVRRSARSAGAGARCASPLGRLHLLPQHVYEPIDAFLDPHIVALHCRRLDHLPVPAANHRHVEPFCDVEPDDGRDAVALVRKTTTVAALGAEENERSEEGSDSS